MLFSFQILNSPNRVSVRNVFQVQSEETLMKSSGFFYQNLKKLPPIFTGWIDSSSQVNSSAYVKWCAPSTWSMFALKTGLSCPPQLCLLLHITLPKCSYPVDIIWQRERRFNLVLGFRYPSQDAGAMSILDLLSSWISPPDRYGVTVPLNESQFVKKKKMFLSIQNE